MGYLNTLLKLKYCYKSLGIVSDKSKKLDEQIDDCRNKLKNHKNSKYSKYINEEYKIKCGIKLLFTGFNEKFCSQARCSKSTTKPLKYKKYPINKIKHPLKPWKDPESLFCDTKFLTKFLGKPPRSGKECKTTRPKSEI